MGGAGLQSRRRLGCVNMDMAMTAWVEVGVEVGGALSFPRVQVWPGAHASPIARAWQARPWHNFCASPRRDLNCIHHEQLAVPKAAGQHTQASGWRQHKVSGCGNAEGCAGRAQALEHTNDAVSVSFQLCVRLILTGTVAR